MYCPKCRGEYRAGIARCPDCGVELTEELFDISPLEPLEEVADPGRLEQLLAVLESGGIPYVVQAGTALSLLDGPADAAAVLPQPWQARVWVLGTRFAEAQALGRQAAAEGGESEPGEAEPGELDPEALERRIEPL